MQRIPNLCHLTQKIPTLVSFVLGDAIFLRHPMQNPNASQWNIGCAGFQTQIFCVGHVNFILFVSISFALGSQRKHSFSVEYGLKKALFSTHIILQLASNVH